MSMTSLMTWLFGHSHRRMYLRRAPMRRLAELLAGVFLLFCVIGFSTDLMDGGTLPWSMALLYAVTSGLNGVVWVFVLVRLQMWVAVLLAIGQFSGETSLACSGTC